MMKRVSVLLLLLTTAILSTMAGSVMPSTLEGAWITRDIHWTPAPAAVERGLRTGEAAVLYFGPERSFALIYCVIYRARDRYAISAGDGQVVYIGSWRPGANGSIDVEYRLVSRTVGVVGETLPGKVERGTIKITPRQLEFKTQPYMRLQALDADAQRLYSANLPLDEKR